MAYTDFDDLPEYGDATPAQIRAGLRREGWTVTRAKPRSGMYIARKGDLVARGWDLHELGYQVSLVAYPEAHGLA